MSPFGISSVWRSTKSESGKDLLDQLLWFDLDGIELEYRVGEEMYKSMLPVIKKNKIKILSLHNFFPRPDTAPPEKRPSGDFFKPSSLDVEEREMAVKYTIKTLQHAHDLEARVVVSHLGEVSMEHETEKLKKFYDEGRTDSDECRAFIEEKLNERSEKRQAFFDNVCRSVEKILREAERLSVVLGIENRYYYHQIPYADEIGLLLEMFEGGAIGYWHDVGHAEVLSNLGPLASQEGLLKRYSDRIIGVHLHDVVGYNDHKPPGVGDVDFSSIMEYLPEDSPKIIEVFSSAKSYEIKNSIELLRKQ